MDVDPDNLTPSMPAMAAARLSTGLSTKCPPVAHSSIHSPADDLFPRLPRRQRRYFSQLGDLKYKDYLASPQWLKTKARFKSSPLFYNCCGKCFRSDRPLNIHHKTYRRVGREKLSDLIALCDPCHRATHETARKTGRLWSAHKPNRNAAVARFVWQLLTKFDRQKEWRKAWLVAKAHGVSWQRFAKRFHPVFPNGQIAFAKTMKHHNMPA